MTMVTVNSNWLALSATLSLSDLYLLKFYKLENPRRVDVHKSELAPDYSLLLLTALMHLMRAFIEISLCLWNLRLKRKSTCDLLLCHGRSISHKARDPKITGVGSC